MDDQQLHAVIDALVEQIHYVAHRTGKIPVLALLLNPAGPNGQAHMWVADGVEKDFAKELLKQYAAAAQRVMMDEKEVP